MLLTGCGVPVTWNLYDETNGTNTYGDEVEESPDTIPDEQIVVIERLQGRPSPKIKIFRHLDLNIYKRAAGSSWNDAYGRTRVLTLPGKIEIGVVTGAERFSDSLGEISPSVVFTAEAGRTYWVTWLCNVETGDNIHWRSLAIVDADSTKIIASDYFPSDQVIGQPLTSSMKCTGW